MKKINFTAAFILFTVLSIAQTKNFLDQAYLETTASVDTLVVPDRIYLSILITEKDTKGKTSVEELENKMNTKLKSLGIDTKKQLSLSDVATNFKQYFLKRTDVFKNKAYTLLVYDAVTAGKVIVALEQIDIANVLLTKTEYSKMEELKILLYQKAVSKAKMQAEAMLKPLNQQLGKAIYISDMNAYRSNQYLGKAAGIQIRGMAESDAVQFNPIDIEFDKIMIESMIKVNFAIE